MIDVPDPVGKRARDVLVTDLGEHQQQVSRRSVNSTMVTGNWRFGVVTDGWEMPRGRGWGYAVSVQDAVAVAGLRAVSRSTMPFL
jgi:hypothetical protein